jgi:hypothetical protein
VGREGREEKREGGENSIAYRIVDPMICRPSDNPALHEDAVHLQREQRTQLSREDDAPWAGQRGLSFAMLRLRRFLGSAASFPRSSSIFTIVTASGAVSGRGGTASLVGGCHAAAEGLLGPQR